MPCMPCMVSWSRFLDGMLCEAYLDQSLASTVGSCLICKCRAWLGVVAFPAKLGGVLHARSVNSLIIFVENLQICSLAPSC